MEKPSRRGPKIDSALFDVKPEKLARIASNIDVQSVKPELFRLAKNYHKLKVVGYEHLKKTGPQVMAGNLCFTPFETDGVVLSEHTIISLHVLSEYLDRPARVLASRNYYIPVSRAREFGKVYQRMGYVPATIPNGTALLEQNESVMMFPETQLSHPPYWLRPFFWGFARMAWTANAPVVPMIFTGSREARPCIEKGDKTPTMKGTRQPVPYRLEFLPAIDVRQALPSLDDKDKVSEFCETVRQSMQAAIQKVVEGRPSYQHAVDLQIKHGEPKAGDPKVEEPKA